MGRFWLLKIARTLLPLLFVVTFTFVVLRTSGDPVQSLLGLEATNDEIAQFRAPFAAQGPDPRTRRDHHRTGALPEPNAGTTSQAAETNSPSQSMVVVDQLLYGVGPHARPGGGRPDRDAGEDDPRSLVDRSSSA